MKRNSVVSLNKTDQLYRRLDELCELTPDVAERGELVFWFVQLVRWLRGADSEGRGLRLRYLRTRLEQHEAHRDNVRRCITALVTDWDFEQLMAYGGIARDFHFAGALREWLSYRVLPVACDTHDATSVLSLAFEADDGRWLDEHELGLLAIMLVDPAARPALQAATEEALVELGTQLSAQAHAPSVRNLARVERSPFRGLPDAITTFVAQPRSERSEGALHGRLRQCRLLLDTHKRELADRGADLNTTFQLDRIYQQLERAAVLVCVLCKCEPRQIGSACITMARTVTRNTSGRRLIARSSELLVRNLVETAASVGHHYLEEEKSSWRAAFIAGAGGGALMVLATLIKYRLAEFELPTFYEGIVFSMNYASIFCAAYLLHCTIATKLPAHTAAALAGSVQADQGHRARLVRFLEIWRATVRLQLAGLLGNVVVAGPLAYAIGRGANLALGWKSLSAHAAEHVLHANSLLGPSAVYAAITGLFLWLSSLAGAAADNWTRVTRLRERLTTNLHVMRRIGPGRAVPLATWFVERVGGLTSNVALGWLLGAIPAGFAIAQLPVDIRHVTVSASSVALAWAQGAGSESQRWLAASGVLIIGMVNVAVSFALALQFALSASSRGSARALVEIAIGRWLGRSHARRRRKPRTLPRTHDAATV